MEFEALIQSYDEYIQDANDEDRYEEGWKPVCLNEYYDNEWKEFCRDEWLDTLSDDERRSFEYIDHRAVRCPFCGSQNISASPYEGEGLYQPVNCEDCGASWNDIHEIVDIEIQERGDE
jgi:hypothetical protein